MTFSKSTRFALVVFGFAGLAPTCERRVSQARGAGQQESDRSLTSARLVAGETGPIHLAQLKGSEPPVFALKGGPRGPHRLVFLHGMCGHGLGYAQSFQFAAAEKGSLISLQGDVRCGEGPWAKWSNDLDALDARIVQAFRALGHAEPIGEIAVLGYSQGATRAEALARKWPNRYTRLIEIGAPQTPSPRGLSLRAAVLMAGERDRQDQMKAGARNFQAAKIPATYQMIPEARHGAMGPTPEKTMGEALDWLFDPSSFSLGTTPPQ